MDTLILATIEKNSETGKILMDLYGYLKIIVPILIIVLSSVDFVVAISRDDENIKKAQKKLILRITLGIAFFLIPTILNMIFEWTVGWDNSWDYDINQLNI